ncbi:MAG: metal-dependent hydrolase [Bacteroidetes bacterium]|nr:metal-dependent hydrolase [Bacteroidota bacterium]
MPSAFSHAFAAYVLGKTTKWGNLLKLIFLGAICAAIPDLDAIGFHYGVPYDSLWGHRGITHSISFSLLLAFIVVFVFYKREKPFTKTYFSLLFYFFLATLSHPLLDMLTNGGLGVALFAPLTNERYFFPFHPIRVAPISVGGFFTSRGWEVFKSEFIWVWIPGLILLLIVKIIKKGK